VSADDLPQFAFDATPRTTECERCGADGTERDLRFIILRGRTRYLGRTLCELCAESVLEAMVGD
jgi:hypothetical protein